MYTIRRDSECLPTAEQELLLQAAIWEGEASLGAWEKWRARVDIQRLDAGSHNLLPLLYVKLSGLGVDDHELGRFKGVYRHTWYKNQLLIHRACALLTALRGDGIRTMVLKGTALTLAYYRNHGVRPMCDIDILVPTQLAKRAIQVMVRTGWIPEVKSPEELIDFSHSAAFATSEGDQTVDLHWHLMHEGRQAGGDDRFWEAAVPASIGSVRTEVLSSTDQLIHAFVHGIKWCPVPPIRWVADAARVISQANEPIDWKRLVRHVREFRLVLPVRDGLTYLQDRMRLPVPDAVLQELETIPASGMERLEYRYKTQNYERRLSGYIPIMWFDYCRLRGRQAFLLKLFGFVRYMQRYWGLGSFWQLPARTLLQTRRKLQTLAESRRQAAAL